MVRVSPTESDPVRPLPIRAKPAPEIAVWSMSTGPVPVFVTLTVCIEVPPVAMLPKLRAAALGLSKPVLGGWFFAALVYPTQLVRPITDESVTRVTRRLKNQRIVSVLETLLSTEPRA